MTGSTVRGGCEMRRRDFLGFVGSVAATTSIGYAQETKPSTGEQTDQDLRWFLLNTAHSDFRQTLENLATAWRSQTGAAAEIVSGRNPNEVIVKSRLTERQMQALRPSLKVGEGAVLDEFNYKASLIRHYAPRREV